MTRTRPLYAGLLLWAVLGLPIPATHTSLSIAHADEAMSAAVGKPLQQAATALRAGRYREAMNHIHQADGAPSKTAYESFSIERMRMSAALGLGDTQQAVHSFDALAASGKLPANEKLGDIEGLVSDFYRAGNYRDAAIWASRYAKSGGSDPRITGLGPTLRYQTGDYAGVIKEVLPRVQAAERAGRATSEANLQLLANCYLRLKDEKGYTYAMERLVEHYPKKDYWTNVINHVERSAGISDRLALDMYRIKLATDNMTDARQYAQMIELDYSVHYDGEAKKVIDQAYASHLFGTGAAVDVNRQKRLAALVAMQTAADAKAAPQTEKMAVAAADGSVAIDLGLNYVTAGQSKKGLALVEVGLRKGGFADADEAKLHAGIAFAMGGQKARAVSTLKSIHAGDGTEALATLWLYRAQQL